MRNGAEPVSDRSKLQGRVETEALLLEWSEAPWDTVVYGYPVLQLTRFEVRGAVAATDVVPFESDRDALGCDLVSCRLPHDKLRESIVLEEIGFHFIEMLYQPELDLARSSVASQSPAGGAKLQVRQATESDLPGVLKIAGSAFRNERFHVDPRLPPERADQRYQNWVLSSLSHRSQRLFVILDGCALIAFFIAEDLPDGTCYWHLNAVATEAQGQGYGRRAWSEMVCRARAAGAKRVRSSIVARNYRVLNLYAQLGFRFPAPLMTFHWVRCR